MTHSFAEIVIILTACLVSEMFKDDLNNEQASKRDKITRILLCPVTCSHLFLSSRNVFFSSVVP